MNRTLLFALGVCLVPLLALAQPAPKLARVGILLPYSPDEATAVSEAFREGMRELGYIEGRNIVFESRWAAGRLDRLPTLAAELVRLNVDVIFARSQPAIHAAKNATTTIPILMIDVGDPVKAGLVKSLAKPGGNITGITTIAEDLVAKQLLLLAQAVPGAKRIAVLATPNLLDAYAPELQRASHTAGVVLQPVHVAPRERTPMSIQIERAIAAAAEQRSDALIVLPFIAFALNLEHIARLARQHGLPAVFWQHEFASVGGFMSYGARRSEVGRRAAVYVDKLLKGARPQDLPVEQPRAFDLVLNLNTAKTLGVAVPTPVLIQAVEVIR